MKRVTKFALTGAVLSSAPFLLIGSVAALGIGAWSTVGIELLVLPMLLAFLVLLFNIFGLMFPWGRRQKALRTLSACLGVVAGGTLGIWAGGELRMYGFMLAAERAQPLVRAIEAYEYANGEPPGSLEDLIPEYLPGISDRLPPLRIVTDKTELKGFGDNRWALTALVPQAMLNWDRFIYFPDGNYPQQGATIERVGDWAYQHE